MNVGKLNKRITIQKLNVTPDGMGGQTETWTDLYTVWAMVEPLKSWELFKLQAVESATTVRMIIRYRKDIDCTMQILYNNKLYNINGSPIDKEEKHTFLELLCSEVG